MGALAISAAAEESGARKNASLILTDAGTGLERTVTVESKGQFRMQLGSKNSAVLPTIIDRSVANPIADAYLANPAPPGAAVPDGTGPAAPAK